MTLSDDHSLLFAVNAGSGTVSVFAVSGARLELLDQVPTEDSEPNAVAHTATSSTPSTPPGTAASSDSSSATAS